MALKSWLLEFELVAEPSISPAYISQQIMSRTMCSPIKSQLPVSEASAVRPPPPRHFETGKLLRLRRCSARGDHGLGRGGEGLRSVFRNSCVCCSSTRVSGAIADRTAAETCRVDAQKPHTVGFHFLNIPPDPWALNFRMHAFPEKSVGLLWIC